MSNLVEIHPRPIDTLVSTEQFARAAAQLAVRNSVFILPRRIASPQGVLEGDNRLHAIVNSLNEISSTWDTLHNAPRVITPEQDLDMHGNPYEDYMLSPDYLHYHHTPAGSVRVTFAKARTDYLTESAIAKPILTKALRQGKTDPRYADPDTFETAEIQPGESLIFRLNEPSTSLPLLHDFTTASAQRTAEITAIYRLD